MRLLNKELAPHGFSSVPSLLVFSSPGSLDSRSESGPRPHLIYKRRRGVSPRGNGYKYGSMATSMHFICMVCGGVEQST